MSLYDAIGNARSPMILALNRWWLDHGKDDIPDRADLCPSALKSILPYLLISDVEHRPFRIRYRLVGTRVVEATGLDFTGRYLDELVPTDEDEPWMDDYAFAYERRSAIAGRTVLTLRQGVGFIYEFGIFPLRKGRSTIDQFVAVEDYFEFTHLFGELQEWGAAANSTALKSRTTAVSRRIAVA
jgi:hypothetical protein